MLGWGEVGFRGGGLRVTVAVVLVGTSVWGGVVVVIVMVMLLVVEEEVVFGMLLMVVNDDHGSIYGDG